MATDTRNASAPQPANAAGGTRAAPPRLPPAAQAWRLNRRQLLWTLAVGVVAAPLSYFWYSYQHDRHATALLERGRLLHEQEDWRGAAAAFHQFLRLRP